MTSEFQINRLPRGVISMTPPGVLSHPPAALVHPISSSTSLECLLCCLRRRHVISVVAGQWLRWYRTPLHAAVLPPPCVQPVLHSRLPRIRALPCTVCCVTYPSAAHSSPLPCPCLLLQAAQESTGGVQAAAGAVAGGAARVGGTSEAAASVAQVCYALVYCWCGQGGVSVAAGHVW